MLPQLHKFAGAALNFFLPQNCLGCGKEGELICPACRRKLTPLAYPVCPKCGRPQSSGVLCPACVSWQSSIECIRSPLRFEGLTREAVHQFKYNNLRSLKHILTAILTDYLLQYPLPSDVIVPVPLHPRRLRERGYNQSHLLAAELSRRMNLPLVDGELKRIKYLQPQVKTKSVQERRENVKDSFDCRTFPLPAAHVLLVDDVATSGATMDACAAALKKAGVKSVYGLSLAREI